MLMSLFDMLTFVYFGSELMEIKKIFYQRVVVINWYQLDPKIQSACLVFFHRQLDI